MFGWLERGIFKSSWTFFGTLAGLVLVGWFVTGVVTGNWTDDDWKNRDCITIENPLDVDEVICHDRDTGELVPSN